MDQARPGKRGIWVRKLCKGGGGGGAWRSRKLARVTKWGSVQ